MYVLLDVGEAVNVDEFSAEETECEDAPPSSLQRYVQGEVPVNPTVKVAGLLKQKVFVPVMVAVGNGLTLTMTG